jgi:hypothetical protein
MAEPKLRLEVTAADPAAVLPRLAGIREALTAPGGLDPERFLDDLANPAADAGIPRASLKLVHPTPP